MPYVLGYTVESFVSTIKEQNMRVLKHPSLNLGYLFSGLRKNHVCAQLHGITPLILGGPDIEKHRNQWGTIRFLKKSGGTSLSWGT